MLPIPAYRLVYGDSDLLPGLVVDRFGDYLVVQIASAGMESCRDEIVEALQQVLRPEAILLRNDHSARSLEGLPQEVIAIGKSPAVKALLKQIISGFVSIWSEAKFFPVFPKPVITSSAIVRTS